MTLLLPKVAAQPRIASDTAMTPSQKECVTMQQMGHNKRTAYTIDTIQRMAQVVVFLVTLFTGTSFLMETASSLAVIQSIGTRMRGEGGRRGGREGGRGTAAHESELSHSNLMRFACV